MPDHVPDPTPYPDVNAVLRLLLSDVQALLASDFLAMYLSGSLASGDFDPHSSDIDFVVVTTQELSDQTIAALKAMHERIAASGLKWAAKLEGSYVPQQLMRRYDPAYERYPSINEGRFFTGGHGSEWIIQRHILRKQGIVLAGPAPDSLIDTLQPDDLRSAVRETLREWWQPMRDDPARLHSREYQVFAILTMCRAIYTLEHGAVASKPVSARWAQTVLSRRWADAIESALAWPREPQPDDLSAALGLIRYTLERSQSRRSMES